MFTTLFMSILAVASASPFATIKPDDLKLRRAVSGTETATAATASGTSTGLYQPLSGVVTDVTKNFPPIANQMGVGIEGASIDPQGNLYVVNATHFVKLGMESGGNSSTSGAVAGTGLDYGFGASGVVVTNTSQFLPSIDAKNLENAYFAGTRYNLMAGSGGGAFLIADAGSHSVHMKRRLDNGSVPLLGPLAADKILQPNDLAIGNNGKTIYMSGMNYTETTTAGKSGDIAWWNMEQGPSSFGRMQSSNSTMLQLNDIHRINGIEVSPCGQYLYFTTAQNVASKVTGQRIHRIKLSADGIPMGQPDLLVDFQQVLGDHGLASVVEEGAFDPDGMRITQSGILYATLNGAPYIVKIDTNEEPAKAQVIELDGVVAPANLELGGPDGTTLYIVGKCADKTTSCVDKYEAGCQGKLFASIQKSSASGTGTASVPSGTAMLSMVVSSSM